MSSVYLYPVWTRLWHAFNAILYLVLIFSGLSMQYSNPVYPWIRFDIAVSMHNTSGILLSLNYLFVLAGNLLTPNGKYYRIRIKGFSQELINQAKYYLFGIFKGEKAPYPINAERKFNPLQKVSYWAVIYFLMPLVIITGWAMIYPEMIFIDKIVGTSGLHFTALLHIIVGYFLSIFMVIHVYLCTIGKPSGTHFRAMMSGWHQADH
jgi:thiosulfate reductase cytochrome b subunit